MSDESTPTRARRGRPSGTAASKHSLTINFTEPEDLELYDRLIDQAKADFRRPLDQYVLLSLHTAFPKPELVAEAGELFNAGE
jgi:hypothetical protein